MVVQWPTQCWGSSSVTSWKNLARLEVIRWQLFFRADLEAFQRTKKRLGANDVTSLFPITDPCMHDIFTYTCHKNQTSHGIYTYMGRVDFYGKCIGKYTSPMDGMGLRLQLKTLSKGQVGNPCRRKGPLGDLIWQLFSAVKISKPTFGFTGVINITMVDNRWKRRSIEKNQLLPSELLITQMKGHLCFTPEKVTQKAPPPNKKGHNGKNLVDSVLVEVFFGWFSAGRNMLSQFWLTYSNRKSANSRS